MGSQTLVSFTRFRKCRIRLCCDPQVRWAAADTSKAVFCIYKHPSIRRIITPYWLVPVLGSFDLVQYGSLTYTVFDPGSLSCSISGALSALNRGEQRASGELALVAKLLNHPLRTPRTTRRGSGAFRPTCACTVSEIVVTGTGSDAGSIGS